MVGKKGVKDIQGLINRMRKESGKLVPRQIRQTGSYWPDVIKDYLVQIIVFIISGCSLLENSNDFRMKVDLICYMLYSLNSVLKMY